MPRRNYCFVAMPFRPELNYFFLYIQKYLESKYGLQVERGDAKILTKPLMAKAKDQILRSDLVIGDITGNNANVLYEIGIAHAVGKPVLFLTQDLPDGAPIDIRHFEFIRYDLSKHEELLAKLDNAITNIFGQKYEELFKIACDFLDKFNADTGLCCLPRTVESFQALVIRREQASGILPDTQLNLLAEFLLPLITDLTDPDTIKKYTHWISSLPKN